jgi:hypothetical protein
VTIKLPKPKVFYEGDTVIRVRTYERVGNNAIALVNFERHKEGFVTDRPSSHLEIEKTVVPYEELPELVQKLFEEK